MKTCETNDPYNPYKQKGRRAAEEVEGEPEYRGYYDDSHKERLPIFIFDGKLIWPRRTISGLIEDINQI